MTELIFLSYASEDRERVLPYFDLLDGHGLEPWMDCKKILGGQNWDYEIKTALERSDIVVVFVSKNSVDKRGYAQREIKLAIERYEEKLLSDIYIIPIQLDDGDFPRLLSGIQFLKANEEDVQDELMKSLDAALNRAKQSSEEMQAQSEIRWRVAEETSQYNGIPGYSTRINTLHLSSAKYSDVKDISSHVNGRLVEHCMGTRQTSLSPDPQTFNLMQDEWRRTDTFDAIFVSAKVVGRALSINYSLHWYNAGAAHPVHSPKTFNYLLEPVCFLEGMKALFSDDEGLKILQMETREELIKEFRTNEGDYVDVEWIKEGTSDWSSFSNFSFTETGLSIQFSSYQVACYAAGMPTVEIPYSKLLSHFTDTIVFALNLYRPMS